VFATSPTVHRRSPKNRPMGRVALAKTAKGVFKLFSRCFSGVLNRFSLTDYQLSVSAVHPAVDHGSEDAADGSDLGAESVVVAEKFVRAVYEVNFQWTTPPESVLLLRR